MKNILIVNAEKSFDLSIEAGFSTLESHFDVLTAEDGWMAVKILKSHPVDLVVTDIRVHEMDGFELLLYMNRHFPMVPVIVMSAYASPEMEKKINSLGTFRILEKPVQFDRLVRAIEDGLAYSAQRGSLTGISLGSFLQLIEMEEKTCLLEVVVPSREKGLFYFEKGVLFDAICGDCIGEDAVWRMLEWKNVRLNFKGIPGKKIKRRIQSGLISLLLNATRLQDEEPKANGIHPTECPPALPDAGGSDLCPVEEPVSANVAEGRNEGESICEEPGFAHQVERILRKMAMEIGAVRIISVFDTDGIPVGAFSQACFKADEFAARMAVIMGETERSVGIFEEFGNPEIHIIQAGAVWILAGSISERYRIGLAAGRQSPMGSLLLAINRYIPLIRELLGEPEGKR